MKVCIVAGSHRHEAQSLKVARFFERRLAAKNVESHLLSLSDNPLPLWDESVWDGGDTWKRLWHPIAAQLQSCNALLVVSPEWAGMVPPGLKNFFLLCSTKEVAHKPALIVAVSAARGGAYPVQELRISSYKNNRLCYIPEHLIVRDVQNVLNEEPSNTADDNYIRRRGDYCLDLLLAYGQALNTVRESGVVDHESFANGM